MTAETKPKKTRVDHDEVVGFVEFVFAWCFDVVRCDIARYIAIYRVIISHIIRCHKIRYIEILYRYVPNFSRFFMAGNNRDGTGQYFSDMFGGKNVQDGTGRDGIIMKIVVAWMRRDGTVGVNFLDGTGRYSTITFLFHDGTEW